MSTTSAVRLNVGTIISVSHGKSAIMAAASVIRGLLHVVPMQTASVHVTAASGIVRDGSAGLALAL